jgi:MoaA/NifB/PqqE/SkfB family radical SAM enzyme
MLFGFALTEHCNLRCTHCIRDDVTTVCSLERGLIESVLDQAGTLLDSLTVSLTGGEPLLHEDFGGIVQSISDRDIPYRFVSNGWHLTRVIPLLRRHRPHAVRLSLSGASAETHDRERGRGSFHRVMTGVALLTNERIPCYLSLVVDRRVSHEIRAAADLAESLGCLGISFILPQPTPASAARDSDIGPAEWVAAAGTVDEFARETGGKTQIKLDYGFPFDGVETPCETFSRQRIYVDTRGRLCTCCQLSCYGFNDVEVVADLSTTPLADALEIYDARVTALREAQQPDLENPRLTDAYPCLRCAAASGKLTWLGRYPKSPWHEQATQTTVTSTV